MKSIAATCRELTTLSNRAAAPDCLLIRERINQKSIVESLTERGIVAMNREINVIDNNPNNLKCLEKYF